MHALRLALLLMISPATMAQGTATAAVVGADPLDLDASFAGDGTLAIQIGVHDYGAAGFIEPSGEIVLFGYSDDGNISKGEGVMLRLAADGTQGPMTAFGAQGFGCYAPRNFLTATRLGSGDYLAGGYVQTSCGGIPRQFNVLELDGAGIRLDEFDLVPFNNQLAYVFGLAEQPDGKTVAAGLISGSGFDAATYDFGVARFLPGGTLDTSFASGGTFTFDLDNDLDYALDVVVTPQGRILVAGLGFSSTTDRDMLLLALTPDGALDPSFATGGVFQFDRAGFLDSANGVARAASGRIFLAGTTSPDDTTREFTVLGLTEDGVLDPGFSDDGIATIDFGTPVAGASAMTVGPLHRIFVAGSAEIGGTGLEARDAAVAVLLADGRMDPSYNNGAGVTFQFGDQPMDFPQHIDVDELGSRILVSGRTENADRTVQQIATARLIGLDPFLFADGYED